MLTVHIDLQPIHVNLKERGFPDTPDLRRAFLAGNFFFKKNCTIMSSEAELRFTRGRLALGSMLLDKKGKVTDMGVLKAIFAGMAKLPDFSKEDIALVRRDSALGDEVADIIAKRTPVFSISSPT